MEGQVFDGADGSQLAFWTCEKSGKSEEHVHEYDEYMIVVSGQYNLIFNDQKVEIKADEEYYIPKEIRHAGENIKGTKKQDSLCRIKQSSNYYVEQSFILHKQYIKKKMKNYGTNKFPESGKYFSLNKNGTK